MANRSGSSFDDTSASQSSNHDRVELRLRYRELLNEVEQENVNSLSDIESNLGKMTALYAKAQSTSELALDSGLISQYSLISHRSAQKLDTNILTFQPIDFASRLKIFMRSNEDFDEEDDNLTLNDWTSFGTKINTLFKHSPPNIFLLGGSTKQDGKPDKPKKKPRVAAAKIASNSQATAPEKVSAMGKSDQEVTTQEVERVLGILRLYCQKYGPAICFFEFVTDPNSFTRTVENIFHLTFLIKDGFVKLGLDEHQLLTLEVAKQGSKREESRDTENNSESILSITKQQWRDIIRVYKIQKAIIEPRCITAKRTDKVP